MSPLVYLYILPEWVWFALTLILLKLSHDAGYKIGTVRKLAPGENPETAANTISGITIGLLAFILAFTFNGASNNLDLRKDLLMEEANTIRTTYERSVQMPDPYKAQVRALLQEYTEIRLKMPNVHMKEIMKLVKRSEGIQDELWSGLLEVQKKDPATPMLSLYAESLNKMFDLNFKRINAVVQGRISPVIWAVLYVLTFITMAMVGYRIGLHGLRSRFMEFSLIMSFALVLIVIVALDRPNGIMRPDSRPFVTVLNTLRNK